MIRYTKRHAARRWAVAGLGAAALSGCTLDAENPGAITEPGLEHPNAVVALVDGVVGDYDFAFHRSQLFSGLISDEIRSSGTYATWRSADVDGVIDPYSGAPGEQAIANEWWSRLHRARSLAEYAHGRVQAFVPGASRGPLLALTGLYAGMAYRDIGEYFCAAAYDAGPRVEREASLARAKAWLTESIALAEEAGVDSTATMARLIRAQVHLSLGDHDAALADARAVPAGFLWQAHYRQGGHEANETVRLMNDEKRAAIEEGFWNTGDPRVPVVAAGKESDGVTPRYEQQKVGRYSNMPMGKWQEARLIEAEILLARGEVASAIGRMDQVRAAAGLPALDPTLSPAQAEAALRTERKHELFLEGERMLDMRRWGLFPEGWQAECAPIPASELANNPNL